MQEFRNFMDNKLKIVYIKPNDSSFIRGDQKILEEFFQVKPFLLKQLKNKVSYGINNLKMFLFLLSQVFVRNVIFVTWFGDYHAAVMAFAAKLTGKKSVVFIGGQETICYHELKKGVYRKKFRGDLVRYALRNTDIIIANHKSLIFHENHYYTPENPHIDGISHYVKNLNTPVEIINNGIDPQRIVRDTSIDKVHNLVLTVGTMTQEGDFYNKGFDLFIQAASRNSDLQFIMIGLGKAYVNWAEEKYQYSKITNLQVITSYCPIEILNESYNKAKVFVQASITEGMPNTLSEAMLMECVPVGSDINGIPDAIGETGVVIKHRNVEELEAGIRIALKMNTGQTARARVGALFSIEQRKMRIKEVFNSL